jgi:hypothetical protein
MKKLSMTLSSPEVPLTDGKGVVTASVNNGGEQPERVVLGAFASGAPLTAPPAAAGAAAPPAGTAAPATAGAGAAPPAGTGVPATAGAAASPTWTTIDRPLRTIAPGATEQYEVRFDTSGAVPGSYPVKLLPYSADEAPEDYADLARIVTLVVPAPETPVVPKKKFPWWIPVAAAVLVLALGAVLFFLLRPGPVPVALDDYTPVEGLYTEATQVTLTGQLVEPTVVRIGETQIKAAKVSDTRWSFTMPPATGAGDVRLTIESGGKQVALAAFRYTAPPQPPQPSPQPSPSSTPGDDGGSGLPLCKRIPRACEILVDPGPVIRIPRDFVRPGDGVIDPGDIIVPLDDVRVER